MRVSRFRTAAVASWLAVLAVASGVAQDRAETVSPRPGWMPRQMALNSTKLTAAERRDAIAKPEAIEDVILRVPEMAHPEGFYVEPHFGGVSQPSDLGAGAPALSR